MQQLIDCDFTNSGNEHGYMFKAFAYAAKYGLQTAADYPFTGIQGECLYNPDKVAFKPLGMTQEQSLSNEKLKALVAK